MTVPSTPDPKTIRTITAYLSLHGRRGRLAIMTDCNLKSWQLNAALKELRKQKKILTYLHPTEYELSETK